MSINPAASPMSVPGQRNSKDLIILQSLPSKAEFYGVAHRASIDVMGQSRRQVRKTGIICTIGPKTNTPEALAGLRASGMNLMRMNFSHGTHEYHAGVIANLRKSFDVLKDGPPCAIALDTKGKILFFFSFCIDRSLVCVFICNRYLQVVMIRSHTAVMCASFLIYLFCRSRDPHGQHEQVRSG